MLLTSRLLALLRIAPGRTAATVGFGVVAESAVIGQMIALATAIDRALGGGGLAAIVWPVIACAATTAVRCLGNWAKEVSAARAGAEIRLRLRRRLIDQITDLGPGFLVGQNANHVQTTLVDGVEALQGYLGRYAPQAIITTTAATVTVVAIGLIDPFVALVVGVGVTTIPFTRPLWYRMLGERGRSHWMAYRDLSARFLEALQGMATLKSVGASGAYGDRTAEDAARLSRTMMRQTAVSLGHASVVAFTVTAGTALTVIAGAYRFAQGAMTTWQLLLILLLTAEAFRGFRDLQNLWYDGFAGLAAAPAVWELTDAAPVVRASGSKPLPPRAPQVSFERVTFTYPGADAPALRDVSFDVATGETVALLGRSGAGKSTIVSLLSRFFDPDAGVIRLDGTDLRDLDLASLRHRVGVVSQDVHLFPGSVRENLRLAAPTASPDQVEAAARAAHLHDRILALHEGYDTRLGERGAGLSGGERQRLAIARALLAQAPLLVFDEATASLDGATERGVTDALGELRGDRTILVIAHRLSTLTWADRLIVLEGTTVVATGTYDELVRVDGPVADLRAASDELLQGARP